MRLKCLLISAATILPVLSSCGHYPVLVTPEFLQKALNLPSPSAGDRAAEGAGSDRSAFSRTDSWRNFYRLRAQVLQEDFVGVDGQGDRPSSNRGQVLPDSLARTALMQDVVRGLDRVITYGEARVVLPLSQSDCIAFADTGVTTLFSLIDAPEKGAEQDRAAGDPDFMDMLWYYLREYTGGNFVDHSGGKMGKPQVSGAGIGNETIVGLMTVLLEAVMDYALIVPVFFSEEVDKYTPVPVADPHREDYYVYLYKKEKDKMKVFFTAENRKPTLASYAEAFHKEGDYLKQIGPGSKITENELKAIQFVASLSGEQSKALSGLLFRFFGDVEVSFVVGGHFSVGDNDTLARMIEAIVETVSRRVAEKFAYEILMKYDGALDRSMGTPDQFRSIDRLVDICSEK